MNIFDNCLNKIYKKIEISCDEVISGLHRREHIPLYTHLKDYSLVQIEYLKAVVQLNQNDCFSIKIINSESNNEISELTLKELNSKQFANLMIINIQINPDYVEKLIRTNAYREFKEYSNLYINTRYLPFKIHLIFISYLVLVFYIWWLTIEMTEFNSNISNIIQIALVISLVCVWLCVQFYKKSQNDLKANELITSNLLHLTFYFEQHLKKELKIGI